jgi:dUTP pyrophosphatase
MKVKIKRLVAEAKVPTYAKAGDAGMDLTATSRSFDEYGNIVYGTGLAIEIPEGYVGLVFPRSSIAKEQMLLSNAVGVIDSGYRGEIMAKFKPSIALDDNQCVRGNKDSIWCTDIEMNSIYEVGDRIAQLIIMPYPQIEFELANTLSDSDRGAGSYGSTGV